MTIVTILIRITTIPTTTNIFLVGSFEVSIAENGAVKTPPSRRPNTIFQWWIPMVKIKVTALVTVSKNLATVELPTTYRGILPSLISVPLPMAPATACKGIYKASDESQYSQVGPAFAFYSIPFLSLNAFLRILSPRYSV